MTRPAGAAWTRRILISRSPEETREIGERIGRRLTGGELIALEGNLGSGKTHLVQGLARGAGITDQPVTSPTFVFVHEFRGRCAFVHVDLYRIEREEDLLDLGVLEYLDSSWIVAVEWAEKAGNLLPAERLTLRLTHQDEMSRKIEIEAAGARYQKILDAFLKETRSERPRVKAGEKP